jgi:hypothetical protein
MSELTPCNRCNLDRMQRRARARGVEVIVEVITAPDEPLHGWTSARYSDEDTPHTWFQVLTAACAC